MDGGPDIQRVFAALGISLGIGLLVGLQREHVHSKLAGVRTFPLITMLGTMTALVSEAIGGWVVAAGLLAVVAAMTAANFMILQQEGRRGAGLTTEITILLMYVVGAYAAVGEPWVVLAVGATVAVLLYLKGGLHGLVDRIGDKDMRAIMLFAAITFIILPVLPNKEYGPFAVWNPRLIWLVVVLVVGISLGGYIAYKTLGGRGGTLAAGVLGGLISSTATTVSYARRSMEVKGAWGPALLVIALATCMSYARVLVEIGVVSPRLLAEAALPIGIMALVGVAAAGVAWLMFKKNGNTLPEQENPTQLSSALVFAAVFALILLAVEAARRWLGSGGVYAVSALAGLVNLDAITLTNSQLANRSPEQEPLAWRAIVVALIANLTFKGVIIGAMGTRALLWRALVVLGVQVAAGGVILAIWRAQ